MQTQIIFSFLLFFCHVSFHYYYLCKMISMRLTPDGYKSSWILYWSAERFGGRNDFHQVQNINETNYNKYFSRETIHNQMNNELRVDFGLLSFLMCSLNSNWVFGLKAQTFEYRLLSTFDRHVLANSSVLWYWKCDVRTQPNWSIHYSNNTSQFP